MIWNTFHVQSGGLNLDPSCWVPCF
jgi:hypothetical protein